MSNGKPIDELVERYAAGAINRREFMQRAGVLGLSFSSAGALLAACGGKGQTASETSASTTKGAWSLATAAKPYKGTTIHVLDEETGPGGPQKAMSEVIPLFEQESGITVNYDTAAHLAVIQKGEADLYSGRGEYDAVMLHDFQYPAALEAGAIQYINEYLDNAALRDPSLKFEDLIQPETDLLTLLPDGRRTGFDNWNYTQIYWVRKDLVSHPDEQAAFKAKYAYDLKPAETLQQMRDIAEFFTRPAGATLAGKTLKRPFYGMVLDGTPIGLWFELMENFIRNWGGDLYDENGTPTATRPENITATEFWASLWDFVPPNQPEISIIDAPVLAGEGFIAQGFAFPEYILPLDEPGGSAMAGNFDYGPIPFNADSPDTRGSGVTPSGVVMNRASKNKEATYLFMQWEVSEKAQRAWIEAGRYGIIPVRPSLFDFALQTYADHRDIYEAVYESRKYGRAKPRVKSILKVLDKVSLEGQAIGLGKKSVTQGLDDLQGDLEGICPSDCFVKAN